jgi:hypothetical protein
MTLKRWFGALGLALGVLIAIGAVLDATNGEPETIRFSGRIEVSDSGACREPVVKLRPEGHPTQTIRFNVSSWRAGQPCVLPFAEDVPIADSYRVEVPGIGVETFDRSMIDTIGPDGDTRLEIRLSW